MNISPINQVNSGLNFNGKVVTKGKWPGFLEEKLKNMDVFKNLEQSEYNIVGTMKKRYSKGDIMHMQGEPIYKLSLTAEKNNPNFFQKCLYRFGLAPKMNVTRHYHSTSGMADLMDKRINSDAIKNNLYIEI